MIENASKRERKKTENRQAILRTAEELFSGKGYRETTMQEIAERAGVAKGTLYLYFRSKEELYLTVCVRGVSGFGENLEKARAAAKGVEEKIRAVYLAYIRHSLKQPSVFRVLRDTFLEQVRKNLSPATVKEVSSIIGDWLKNESELVRDGIEQGLFDPGLDPYHFSILAWRTATGLVELALLQDPIVIERAGLENLFEASIDILLRGIKRLPEQPGNM
ncbi:TetR/AcrR family transcriptional regulator [Candidatus Solincola tengchongensis]|uniref:TetR/AcrR family transcriptional regulator n=1 Tax=Candidatus Solincola tengchongensis TaxID=2900693 RepID=UPI00257E3B54|nr:TetR/AcrR family transcriptional regulator [Candidatus Solincola tengchongensis]